MIALAWRTARSRATSLAGSFVALALGVALLSALALTLASNVGAAGHPRWFSRPEVVVAGADTVTISSGGDQSTVRTSEGRAVPAALTARLAALDAKEVVDYAAYAAAPGAPGRTLHPWAAAGLHDFTWRSGGPPVSASQVVLTAPTSFRPGDRITIQTALGPRAFTVSGVISTGAQAAFYATAPVAAGLAGGRIDAIALAARSGEPAVPLAGQVRAAVRGAPVRVLTGDHRRDAEPDPDADLLAVGVALLGTTSGLAGFVSMFVVAGTFSFAVAARRREFGLLRTAGATPRQVRRLVLGEALAVGVLASLAGGALGTVIARPFARWLAGAGLAPAGFSAHFIWWPVAAAFGAGLLIAMLGSWLAARRAGRVSPAEVLRDPAADGGAAMPLIRWLAGLVALAGAVTLMVVLAGINSAGAAALILPIAMLLIICSALLAPVLIRPLLWLLSRPMAASSGAVSLLASHNAAAALRRTAATAAPIALTVGFAGSMLAGFGTVNGTQQAAMQRRITATALVTPAVGNGGLADQTVAAIRRAPGVRAAVPVTDSTVYVRSAGDPDQWTGRYVNGPDLPAVLRLPVVAGRLADLTGTGTIAVPAGSWRLGQTASLWLGDSAPVKLRVVAVLADQIDMDQTVLLPWALRAAHTQAPLATTVYLRMSPGAPLGPLRAAAAAGGGDLIRTSDYVSAANAQQNRINDLMDIAILGLALAYTGLAIANTLVMSIGTRVREFATLRLSAATRGQVLRAIGLEACLVAGTGITLAAAVTALVVGAVRPGLAHLAPSVRVIIPWLPIGGIALACLMIALLASVLPAAVVLRGRPAVLAGASE